MSEENKRNDNEQLFEEHNNNEPNENQDKQEQSSSYYYSYGPFKSVPNDVTGNDSTTVGSGTASEVEVTPPDPIKAAPTRSYYTSQGMELKAGNVDFANYSNGGSGNGTVGGNWQVNQARPKSSFKTVFISFLAGMLVISSLMFVSDRYNLFTGSTNASEGAGSSSGNAVTTSANVNTPQLDRPGDITSIVKNASPAVVKIETYVKQSKRQSSSNSFMDDPFFRQFFGDGSGGSNQQRQNSNSDQLIENGLGSGFIFDKSGYILTNQHVVAGADQVKVVLEGHDKPYVATVLGSSFDLDLAVLKIEGTDFPTINIGNSDQTQSGDWLVAIGNPNGFDHTVTAGVLSAKERSISIPDQEAGKTREYKHLIQTDASINPGNSGGPLLNMNGEVIGMNVAVSADSQGIGFAIPAKTILENLSNLKANKEIPQVPVPFIGATLATMTDDIAKQLNTDKVEGSIVTQVYYRTPAYDADLRAYDIITGIDGTKYATNDVLIEAIQKKKVGDEVTFNIVRNGKAMDLKVKIGDKNKYNANGNQ
ncbi:S1C family serine protease [Paenibacillus terrigena]|uniref:S1C family serine protease n=1 Tax=Paenibacillus terrigena TaxID=369333 RepID=UPI000380B7D5|nr:trypsin-like peptidase domain-containing protein [Paenibacillus terrigena]